MKWFLQRLKEPSTWAGFSALIPAVLVATASGVTPAVIGQVAAGVAAVLIKEKPRA